MERYNEDELLYLSRQGCPIAREYLYQQYYQYIQMMVKKIQLTNVGYIDKNDVVQEVMMSCYYAFETYRPDCYCMLKTYLHTIIRNRILTDIKNINNEKKKFVNAIFFDAPIETNLGGQYGDVIADTSITYQPHKKLEVQEGIDAYTKQVHSTASLLERNIMKYQMLGYTVKDIALVLKVDARTVYNATYRLQKKLDKSKYI